MCIKAPGWLFKTSTSPEPFETCPSLVITSNSSPFHQESESPSSGSSYAQWLLIVHRGIHRILLISIPGFRKSHTAITFQHLGKSFLFKTWKKPELLLPSITLTKHLQLLPMMSWESVGSGVQWGTDLDSPHWDRGWSSSILHSGVKYGQQILLSPRWTVAHTIKLSYLIQLLREMPCLQADLWANPAEDTPYRSGVMRSLTGQ